MKTRRYLLRARQVVNLWDEYNQKLNTAVVAKELGISRAAVDRWVADIQMGLAGEKVVRVKGGEALEGAIRVIRSRTEQINPKQPVDTGASIVENPAMKVERLWNEIQLALGELAVSMAEEKTKDIIEKSRRLEEEAKKSNILGFIQKRWEGR